MKRLFFVIFVAFCSISSAPAEIYVATNLVSALSPSARPQTHTIGLPARYTVYARNSGGAIDLSDYRITWEVSDPIDGELLPGIYTQIRDATNGHVTAFADFTAQIPGLYRARMVLYLNETTYAGIIADDWLTITNAPSGSGGASIGDIIINNISTADVQVVESGTGNVVTGLVASGSTVTAQRGEVTGGGGGMGPSNFISETYGLNITNDGSNVFFSVLIDGGTNTFSYWVNENGTNVLVTTDGTYSYKQYFSTNPIPEQAGAPIIDLSSIATFYNKTIVQSLFSDGSTNIISYGGGRSYFLALTNDVSRVALDASFDATVSESLMIEFRGTNTLELWAAAGTILAWATNPPAFYDNATTAVLFAKPFGETNWTWRIFP